jgi:glycosyltransferase involved in cell wall biosynthesis
LRGILRKENPDVIHSNDLPTHQMVSGVAGRLGIPRICHHRFGYNGAAIDWFNKYGAERHVFVSQALMAELCAGSQRLHESCRAVVYDGLPCPPLSSIESKAHARATLGLDASRKVVVFAGQIIERKGVADLLRSWAALGPELAAQNELIIVGDDLAGKGAYRLEMERLAQGLGCGARFVGFQKNVHEWLSAADVAVVPSHVEPLGNATLEAMAHGLPVIGTSVGGIPEMVVHERTGLLVPPKTPAALAVALTRFLTDERLRLQCGANGRLRCEERFSLMAHTLAALEEYAKVVGQSQ